MPVRCENWHTAVVRGSGVWTSLLMWRPLGRIPQKELRAALRPHAAAPVKGSLTEGTAPWIDRGMQRGRMPAGAKVMKRGYRGWGSEPAGEGGTARGEGMWQSRSSFLEHHSVLSSFSWGEPSPEDDFRNESFEITLFTTTCDVCFCPWLGFTSWFASGQVFLLFLSGIMGNVPIYYLQSYGLNTPEMLILSPLICTSIYFFPTIISVIGLHKNMNIRGRKVTHFFPELLAPQIKASTIHVWRKRRIQSAHYTNTRSTPSVLTFSQ